MTQLQVITLAIALVFAAVHLFGGRLVALQRRAPRSRWLSFAGGVSVAYVFVHLLPEAEARGRHFRDIPALEGTWAGQIEAPIYLLALAGLVIFYGLERYVLLQRSEDDEVPGGVFWVHIGSFAVYNALITYLLVRESELEPARLGTFALAMGLHYLVNDMGLRAHHPRLYHRRGRFLLAACAPLGWVVGVMVPIDVLLTSALFGFLCGATLLNVLKEEIPEERESRFWAFVAGAAGYSLLLLFV